MSRPSRAPAVLAYLLPIIGWLYVLFFQRKNALAMYHLRQAVGLCLVLVLAFVGWAVITWVLAWIPLLDIVGVALFTVVITAYLYGVLAWIMGIVNALRCRIAPLPVFGRWASRLPIR